MSARATMLAVLALFACTAGAQGLTIRRVGPVGYGYGLTTLPDGGVARVLNYDYGSLGSAQTLERIAESGKVTDVLLPRGVVALSTPLTVADGSLALEGRAFYDAAGRLRDRSPALLVTVPRRGRPRVARLSDSVGDPSWSPTAIAPDGAAWRARVCSGLLSRTAPNGAETRIRLPPMRCRAEAVAGYNSAFAFGPDGSVWFASLCQAWIARVPLAGRARMWRLSRRPHCEFDYDDFDALRTLPPRLLATPDGGLRFENGRIDARGRLRLDHSGEVPDAVDPDGGEWRVHADAITFHGRRGLATRLSVPDDGVSYGDGPRQFVGGTIGPDGRFWYLSAVPADQLSLGWHNALMHVGAVDADGDVDDQALPRGRDSDVASQPVAAAHSVWLGAPDAALRVDVRPHGGRRMDPRVTSFLARRGATVWIQVACSAAPGSFCTTRAGLLASWGSAVARHVHVEVPAGQARAIPLQLTRRAMRTLRRRGRLTPFATVDVGGGYTVQRIVVR